MRQKKDEVENLIRQILSEATALKHVGSRTTKPYGMVIAEKAEQALGLLSSSTTAISRERKQ